MDTFNNVMDIITMAVMNICVIVMSVVAVVFLVLILKDSFSFRATQDGECECCEALSAENEKLHRYIAVFLPWIIDRLRLGAFVTDIGDDGEELLDRIDDGEFGEVA